MQLFESSPEEDNRCPQVRQGPPPVPRSPPALPAGEERPGTGGRRFGESWLGIIYLFVSMYMILPPCARAVLGSGVTVTSCWAMGSQGPGRPTSPGAGTAQALFPRGWVALCLSSGLGRLVWGLDWGL